jgi:hypothetical protein
VPVIRRDVACLGRAADRPLLGPAAAGGSWRRWRVLPRYPVVRGASLPARRDRLEFLNAHGRDRRCAASRQRGRCGRGSVVEHHLAKVRVAGSNPVVRSECRAPSRGPTLSARLFGTRAGFPGGSRLAEWPSGLGKGLQSPVRGFDSRFRLAGG